MGRLSDSYMELFGEAHARGSDPHTSHEAAKAVEGNQANELESIVAAAVEKSGQRGMTSDEIVSAIGLNWNVVTPRLAPLRRKNILTRQQDFATGKWKTRPGKSGKAQQIHWFRKSL